jgi:hypothetical protein
MPTQPLTPAEAAVVEVLQGESECSWHIGCDAEECHEPRARAVVAAVREHLYAEVADRMLLHAAEAELNDATEETVHVFKVAANNIRQWASQSRPTSKEHQ